MIQGACLCGGVRFEIDAVAGPFELCHCSRCRKLSGTAFFGGVGVRAADFQFLQGRELIRYYDAPILRKPPVSQAHRNWVDRCLSERGYEPMGWE